MPINYPQFRQLSASESGGLGSIDFGGAIRSGLQNAQLLQELKTAPYKQKLIEAQTEAALRPKPIGGKISQLEQLRDRFEPGTEQYKTYDAALKNALEGSQGITVFDPQGNPMVQIGGGGGGRGGKGGGAIYQAQNGDQYQTPTSAVASNLQQRIVGQKIVQPYLNNIIETLPQFQSGWTKGLAGAEGFANKWFNTNFDLPSKLAKGQSSLGLAAEGMLRQFGLNATGHNLKRMEAILTPTDGESVERYRNRAMEQAVDFAETAREAQVLSRSGIPVKETNQNFGNQIKSQLNTNKTPDKKENNVTEQKQGKLLIDTKNYDIPEGWLLIYKKGEQEPYVYPPDIAQQKVESGAYSYD